jgi:hypothetical protein
MASLIALALAAEAHAQGTLPTPPGVAPYLNRPTVSPYLNLLQRNTNPAINYYGIVRPEFQFRRTINQLASQVQEAQADINTGQAGAVFQTGHPVQFMNLSHFYAGGQGQSGTTGRSGMGRTSTTSSYQSGGGGGTGSKPSRSH